MTGIAGFLVGDYGPNGIERKPLGLSEDIESSTLADNFPPWGVLLWMGTYPDRRMMGPSRDTFISKILRLYDEFAKKGFQDVRMATTILNDALEGYELREIGRNMSPDSFEDWCTLADINFENETRIRTGGKGLLVVARIQSKKEP